MLTDKAACHIRGGCADVACQAVYRTVFQLRRDITGGDQIFDRQRVVKKDRDQIAESDSGNGIQYRRQHIRSRTKRVRETAVFGKAFRVTDKTACSVLDVADFYRALDAAILYERVTVDPTCKGTCGINGRIVRSCVEEVGKRGAEICAC